MGGISSAEKARRQEFLRPTTTRVVIDSNFHPNRPTQKVFSGFRPYHHQFMQPFFSCVLLLHEVAWQHMLRSHSSPDVYGVISTINTQVLQAQSEHQCRMVGCILMLIFGTMSELKFAPKSL